MHRLLLLIHSNSYRASDFLAAASRLGVEVIVGTNVRQAVEVPGTTLTLDFLNPEKATEAAVSFSKTYPFQSVVSTDEGATVLAAMISKALSLPHNRVTATAAAKDKRRLREILTAAGVRTPSFRIVSTEDAPEEIAHDILYPVVLKPTFLSASRGVIRANNPKEFENAFLRISNLLNDPKVRRQGGDAAKTILVDAFIPGFEVAVEGLLQKGALTPLAIFDKPNPLNGPFFEETIYVTPSRLNAPIQKEIVDCTQKAVDALGLLEGPIHAEIRVHQEGVWMKGRAIWLIEIAARSIGGLCSRTLRFGLGCSLEEVIIRHATGMPNESLKRERRASGVMMIPIPTGGILIDYHGVAEAKTVPHIEDVVIMLRRNQKVIPLPEGDKYLGFIFARAERAAEVEAALRSAHQKLTFDIRP